MAQDIILRNLTSPPVKGATTPLISTVLVQRDGTRGGTEEPGDPPPVGEQGTPITDGLSYTDTRFAGSTYPPLTPGRVGSGTNDPSFSFGKIEYLGAFFMYGRESESVVQAGRSVCFNPPNGNNGTYGSIFTAVFGYNDAHPIYEFQIPETLGTEFNTLPEATQLTGSFELMTGGPKTLTSDDPRGNNTTGWMRVINGELIVYNLIGYDAAGQNNTRNIVLADNVSDLSQSTLHGYMNLNSGTSNDRFCHYLIEIPESRRSEFNNHSFFAGNYLKHAIIGRLSQGASFYGWNPENINRSVIDQTPGTIYGYHSTSDTFERYSANNEVVNTYFENLIGITYDAWVQVQTGATDAQSTYDRLVGDLPLTLIDSPRKSNHSIAIPDYGIYTNTVVVKNQAGTVTYIEGTDYNLTVYDQEFSGYGYGSKELYGKHIIEKVSGGAIADGATITVSYTYLSQRFDDYTSYTYPDKSVPDDSGNQNVAAQGGFWVPNTDTIMLIGDNRAARYGSKYKCYNIDKSFWGGGPTVKDARDYDKYYWLFNVNDIKNSTTLTDIQPYKYGILDENRWMENKLHANEHSNHTSGFYDPATKRLYVVDYRVDAPWGNRFTQLVSVYYVNY